MSGTAAEVRPQAAVDPGTDLAMRRTGMAFQRTRMAADRTLMAVIRTSLSLIGFGFTLYQVIRKAEQAKLLAASGAPRNFGVSLVALGVITLILGILYHVQFMLGLRGQRESMKAGGLIHAQSGFPVSLVLVVAVALLGIGVLAITSMVFRSGPYQ